MKRKKSLHKDYLHLHVLAMCGAVMVGVFVFSVSRNIQAITLPNPVPPVPLAEMIDPPLTAELTSMVFSTPILFEPNIGQAVRSADFIAHRGGSIVTISTTGIETDSVIQSLVRSNVHAKGQGIGKQESVSNYFIGNDQKNWKTGIENFRGVSYAEVYPNIDLEYGSDAKNLTYQFIVKPEGNPAKIELSLGSATRVEVKPTSVTAETKQGTLHWGKLYAYQIVNGFELQVDAAFVAKGKKGYGFKIGAYDKKLPLVIDPLMTLTYGTYLGGSVAEPSSPTIVLDSSENIVVFGSTISTNFPTLTPYQGANAGNDDLFIAKFSGNGQTLLYSTYLGGGGTEQALEVGIDASDNIYFCGSTNSSDYPVLNAAQGSIAGSIDGYLTKLNASGSSLGYSTYLGGSGSDNCVSEDVSSTGEVALVGFVSSTNFPLVNAAQGTYGGGSFDSIVMKYDASGAIVFSTYLGGSVSDFVSEAVFDPSGNVWSIGRTLSTDFPTLSPYQAASAGADDGFATKYSSTGTLLFSTYFGGNGADFLSGADFDSTGNLYISGSTASTNFPTLNPFQSANAGGSRDAFITKINPAFTALIWGSYLGGNGFDTVLDVTPDASQNIYFTGISDSTNLAVVNALQPAKSTSRDAIVGKLFSDGRSLEYLSYFGGTGASITEGGSAGALKSSGEYVVVGRTDSTDLLVTSSAFQQTFGGGASDVFFSIFNFACTTTCGSAKLIDYSAPSIIATQPVPYATDVALQTPISVWFNEDIDAVSISKDTFLVTENGAPVSGTVSYTAQEARFVPDAPFAPTAHITVTITTGVQDQSGNAFSYTAGIPSTPFIFSFTTVHVDDEAVPVADVPTPSVPPLPPPPLQIIPGSRILVAGSDLVFYIGKDYRKYLFKSLSVYESWFGHDFSGLITLPVEKVGPITWGGSVTYRPGERMVKLVTDPRVYVIGLGAVLRHVASESLAAKLYGALWNLGFVSDIPEIFFSDYTIGEPVVQPSDYGPQEEMDKAGNLETELERIQGKE